MKRKKSTITAGVLIAILLAIFSAAGLFAQDKYSFNVEKLGEGQPLIFIPGLISSGEVWEETVAYFSKNYECHVLTLAGFAGQPALDNPPYLAHHQEEIIRYIKQENLENVTLIGHSIGGYLSMLIGLEQVPQIRSLIIVDALPFFSLIYNPDAKEGFDEASAEAYISRFKLYEQTQIAAYRKMAVQGMSTDSTKWGRLVRWANDSDLKTEAYASHEMLAKDLRDDLSEIKIPMLVFGAYQKNERFPQYTFETANTIYKEQYSLAPACMVLMAEDSKHFIMYDAPEWLYSQMENFLSEQAK